MPHLLERNKGTGAVLLSCDLIEAHTWDSSLTCSCPKNSRRKSFFGNASSALAHKMEEGMLWGKK